MSCTYRAMHNNKNLGFPDRANTHMRISHICRFTQVHPYVPHNLPRKKENIPWSFVFCPCRISRWSKKLIVGLLKDAHVGGSSDSHICAKAVTIISFLYPRANDDDAGRLFFARTLTSSSSNGRTPNERGTIF